jgi:fatty acid-binding protein DegV
MTIVVADTTCGLPRKLLEERRIPLIPQIVTFGEESYHDDKDLDTATFLSKLKASPTLPKTAAPEPSLYYPVFAEARKRGESVIVVAPTSKASGTVRSAQTAAQDFPNVDIRVVDMIPRGRLYFVVDTLEYLAKGGRIGGAKKLLAELLEIKPILQVKQGQVEPFEQHRTKKRALARLVEVVTESCKGGEDAHLCALQVEAQNEAQALVAELKSKVPVSNIPIYELPPAIVVHAGPRAMGVGFFTP